MEEVTCRVVLDTAEPSSEHFQGYLDGASIASIEWSAVGNFGNYVQVEYTGTRRALETMIKKHFSTNDRTHDQSLIDGIVPVDSTMEKVDRDKLIELLIESATDMYSDKKSYEVAEDVGGMLRDGVRGYVDESDEALLAEASSFYVNDDGDLADYDWDPTDDEVFRIFAKYKFPNVLCKVCGGKGEDCGECRGSGLFGQVLKSKYTVVRSRRVVECVELRATSPQEAAEKSKKSNAWIGQSGGEQLTLEVFLTKAATTPLYRE